MSAGSELVPMLSPEHGVGYDVESRSHPAARRIYHAPAVRELQALLVAMLVSVARRTALSGLRRDPLPDRLDAGAGSYRA